MRLDTPPPGRPPGLLVSVRGPGETREAIHGGASVIDIKDPFAGPLGAPDPTTIAEVVSAVGGRRPVTVAAGDLDGDAAQRLQSLAINGVAAVKFGLAACADAGWEAVLAQLIERCPAACTLVPAAYADCHLARSPSVEEVLEATIRAGLRWMLIDTWNKREGDLFSHVNAGDLELLVRRASLDGVSLVLAGSLGGKSVTAAAELSPALIGVRGAACRGDRTGTVDRLAVAKVRQQIELAGCRIVRHDPATESPPPLQRAATCPSSICRSPTPSAGKKP